MQDLISFHVCCSSCMVVYVCVYHVIQVREGKRKKCKSKSQRSLPSDVCSKQKQSPRTLLRCSSLPSSSSPLVRLPPPLPEIEQKEIADGIAKRKN